MKTKDVLVNSLIVLIATLSVLLVSELILRVVPYENNAGKQPDYRDS